MFARRDGIGSPSVAEGVVRVDGVRTVRPSQKGRRKKMRNARGERVGLGHAKKGVERMMECARGRSQSQFRSSQVIYSKSYPKEGKLLWLRVDLGST